MLDSNKHKNKSMKKLFVIKDKIGMVRKNVFLVLLVLSLSIMVDWKVAANVSGIQKFEINKDSV